MGFQRYMEQALSQWMRAPGPEGDIVLSSRVRIARNLARVPFPNLATAKQTEDVLQQVQSAVERFGNLEWVNMDDLSAQEKQVLVEKHLISPNLVSNGRKSAVVLSPDESISIMVNEEDHLRIQCLAPGLQVEKAFAQANRLDDALEETLTYAFDNRRGYLTSCPTNVGTGIRASVMLHLPALVITQQIKRIVPAITQVGLTVRGIYGEGSDAIGNLFQVSNQLTLGQTEQEIIESLISVVTQLIDHEREARLMLLRESEVRMRDKAQRAYGILSHAVVIDSKEAASRLSDLRLGVDLGIIEGVSPDVFPELMVMMQPAFIQQYYKEKLSPEERDVRRAELIRTHIQLSTSTGGASL